MHSEQSTIPARWRRLILTTLLAPLAHPALAGSVAPADNVLLIIADDMGIDQVGLYGDPTDPSSVSFGAVSTPAIDALASSGVLFTEAWSNPSCSPTRAGILTGQPAYEHGIGNPVKEGGYGLDESTTALPAVVGSHTTGLFGKWHLGDVDASGADYTTKPLGHGFATHRGSLKGYPTDQSPTGTCDPEPSSANQSYWCWDKYEDGVLADPTAWETYATMDTTEEAQDWITDQAAAGLPWVAIVAYNAPHAPWDEIPDTDCLPATYTTPTVNRQYFQLMIQCMDNRVSALVDHLADVDELENTTIIFVGDNGTAEAVGRYGPGARRGYYPENQWKSTVYQGGVHVPLIIADGYHLLYGVRDPRPSAVRVKHPGATVTKPVHTQDLFNTIIELVSETPLSTSDLDSVSMVPYLDGTATSWLRDTLYTEKFAEEHKTGAMTRCQQALRNRRYKLIRKYEGTTWVSDELYDLWTDEAETNDLLSGGGTAAYRIIRAKLAAELPHNCS